MTMTATIEYTCPICKGALAADAVGYHCASCDRSYPFVLGIADFRVSPLPGMNAEEDLEMATLLREYATKMDFNGLLRLNWDLSPPVSAEREEVFAARAMILPQKGEEILQEVSAARLPGRPPRLGSALEIGCGTGGFLVAAKRQFEHVIGTDVGYRRLVLAEKRLQEAGLNVPLLCAAAEHLPFADGQFDLVVAEDVIEHVQDQQKTVHECARVLTPTGSFFLATANRFSITPEPHVGLWGVGWLPRSIMPAYVRRRRGVTYEGIRILSFFEIRRLLTRNGLTSYRVTFPPIPEDEQRQYSWLKKKLLPLYDLLRALPLTRPLLYLIGPFFYVQARSTAATR
jgi:ubiquinone/menaquinone biosynthesis C-methylase UbiE